MPTLPPPPRPTTVLQALVDALNGAATYNRNVMVAPAAVLWPDEERVWEPLLPLLRKVVPHLLTLGTYDPETRTGPAIWLRCMLARVLDPPAWKSDAIPIIYLPGVGRSALRDIETCPKHTQPLVELQHRGVFWSQINSRDWTVFAFLKSKEGGLGLKVTQDEQTAQALSRAILPLADTRIDALSTHQLEAADFDQLLTPDPVRDLLRWLDAPKTVREQWGESRWQAFRSRCKSDYAFDPQTDGELAGTERLGGRDGNWDKVWTRFAEAPASYPNLPALLRRATPPTGGLFREDESSWPQINEKREDELRKVLSSLGSLAPHEAVKEILQLEERHGMRRAWIWAQLGEASLAMALEHLAPVARMTEQELGGTSPAGMATLYQDAAWRVDAGVLRALDCVRSVDDVAAVRVAIRAVYLPWLERAALRLQELVEKQGFPGATAEARAPIVADPGECILFADGLRFDTGKMLEGELRGRGYALTLTTRWVGLPSVTATSKPAVSPVAALIAGTLTDTEFEPGVAASGKSLTQDIFRKLLKDAGYQVLEREQTGDPSGRAWTERGNLDHTGHQTGAKLAWRIGEEIHELVERVEALFAAGWKSLKIVTDHGWLLMPDGLPKTKLPHYLAETRWGRCAVLKADAHHGDGLRVVPWRWHDGVTIALAPGISTFYEGTEYAHGGLSLQECVTPYLVVSRTGNVVNVVVEGITWQGLRCRVRLTAPAMGHRFDLRTKAADASTSLVKGGKPFDPSGAVSVVVEDDDKIGAAVFAVVLDAAGTVVAKIATPVGGD